MKKTFRLFAALVLLSTLNAQLTTCFAQGTAFTYQGRLNNNGTNTTGTYDVKFTLFATNTTGTAIAGPVTNAAVGVSNGLFTVTLNFGNAFTGASNWLELAVRTNGAASFTTLAPRQQLTPVPYAIYATTASNLSGTVSAAQLPAGVVTNNATGLNLSGSFSGNGTSVTNVNAVTLGGTSSAGFWRTNGNAGANPTNGAFLGTTDNLPLEFKVNGQRALRLEPNATSANVIGGFSGNVVSSGVVGGFVVGGGFGGVESNRVVGNFASVLGGSANVASGQYSSVMGHFSTASGPSSTAMGNVATASGQFSTAIGDIATASGLTSFAAGSSVTALGNFSTAMGRSAQANHNSTFVWSDDSGSAFSSTAINQFLIRATGGVGINTNNPGTNALLVNGSIVANNTIVANNFSGNGAGVTNVGIGTLNSSGSIAWGNFSHTTSLASGVGAYCVTTADVNGDGKVDVISANYGTNTLSVLTNNGSGGFGSNATLVVGAFPRCVVATDVNGDGKVDLVSANSGVGTLTVLTNNGIGIFGFKATVTVGSGPVSLAAVDLNADGKVDLACVNNNDSTLMVLTNSGNGVFGLKTTLNPGSNPLFVISVDANLDGKPDLICVDNGDSTLAVLTNSGSATFGTNSFASVGNGPLSVAAGDVNGDGRMDLITANYSQGTVTVMTNNASGGYGRNNILNGYSSPAFAMLADINGDGLADVIEVNSVTFGFVSVLTNVWNQNFSPSVFQNAGVFPQSGTVADVNGDGLMDIIIANATDPGSLTVLYNTALFSGNGSSLTSLNAANLIGAVPSGTLTSVPAGNLTGTVADGLLSANIALRNTTNAFTGGTNTFAGVVGIGMTTPVDVLHVAGQNTRIRAESTNATFAGFVSKNTQAEWFAGLNPSDGSGLWELYENSPLSGTRLVVTTNGNVGINTISPQWLLDVNGSMHIGTYVADGTPKLIRFGDASYVSIGENTADDRMELTAGNFSFINGNVSIGAATFTNKLQVVNAYCNGSTWVNASDRNLKQDFASVDAATVLEKIVALPIQSWSYKTQPGEKHIGPVAQDFHAAFGLGQNDTSITTVDESGVALAAIQGLNQKLEAQKAKNAELEQQLTELKALVQQLADKK